MIVTLHPESHTYYDDTGRQYVSVTTLLGAEDPFDGPDVAARVVENRNSKYFGWTVEECLVYWQASADLGTQFHNAVEHWIKTGELPSKKDPNYPSVLRFSKGNFKGKLHAEVCLWDEQLRIAGTTDIIEERPTKDIVWDLKTCRKIDADKMIKYSMQLEIYRRFRQRMTMKHTEVGGVIWYPDFMENPDPVPKIERPLPLGNAVDELFDRWAAALVKAQQLIAA